jgi:hypothetical protein
MIKVRPRLIFQIHNPSHETRVTPLKTNLKKQRSKILNQTNILRYEIEGKNQKKKQCRTKQIAIKRIKTKFNIKPIEIKCERKI